jgi:hypothetical protein
VFLLSPKSCSNPQSESRDQELDLEELTRGFCSSRAAQVLTGALDRSDRCEPFVGFASGDLLNPCVFGLCRCWSVFGSFGGGLVALV